MTSSESVSSINEALERGPIRVGLVASLFFQAVPDNDAPCAEVFERFAATFQRHTSWFSEAETDRSRPADAKALAYPRRRIGKVDRNVVWRLSSVEHNREPALWSFRGFAMTHGHSSLSYVWWSLDPGALTATTYLTEFLEAARTLPCQHGGGGLGIVQPLHPIERQMSEKATLGLAARFHGLDVLGAMRASSDATDGIKCVNWLTLLDNDRLAKLGGKETLRAQLSEAIVFHDIPNGVVLQAGPEPVLGDAHLPDELAAYREVALALKPIFATGPFGTFRDMEGFPHGKTTPWRNRFFPGVKWPP